MRVYHHERSYSANLYCSISHNIIDPYLWEEVLGVHSTLCRSVPNRSPNFCRFVSDCTLTSIFIIWTTFGPHHAYLREACADLAHCFTFYKEDLQAVYVRKDIDEILEGPNKCAQENGLQVWWQKFTVFFLFFANMTFLKNRQSGRVPGTHTLEKVQPRTCWAHERS